MTVERYLRLIAGCFLLATVLLGYFHSPYWFLLTGFVAINLIQSPFTDWCPMMTFLRNLGVRDERSLSIHGSLPPNSPAWTNEQGVGWLKRNLR
jgi:Protein of unknown function (DUF2892)